MKWSEVIAVIEANGGQALAAQADIGGEATMRAQMNHLIRMVAEPNVTMQVIPFSAGAHAGMPGSFVLMDFPDAEDPEMVYIESMAGDLFLEAEVDVRLYTLTLSHLQTFALSPADLTKLIAP